MTDCRMAQRGTSLCIVPKLLLTCVQERQERFHTLGRIPFVTSTHAQAAM